MDEKRLNILFIENEDLNKKLIENIIKDYNYNYSFIENEEKIKEIKAILKDFNLIVYGNIEKIKNLEENLNFIVQNSKNTNIILLLDINDLIFIEEKIDKLPIYHFLLKPFNINEFKFLIYHASYDSFLKNENEKLLNNLKQTNFILQQQKIEMTRNFIQVKELQDELIKKEKLSALGVFTSSILHDIKNSLGIINGYTEILSMKDPALSKFTNKIHDEVNSLVIMMEDLLDFVKGKKGENYLFEELDLIKFLEYLKEFFYDYTNRINRIENKFIVESENIEKYKIKIDLLRFKRVYFNILKNAYEACLSANRNIIKIETFIKVINENEIQVEIKDNGIGIPEENISKLFETFFTSGKKGGTGLGLAISKNIITNFGGKIEVKSTYGEGTSMIIILPIYKK
ncbi:MAG: ATP-binding protein [Spirochaetes bacterium]|nr:ATP-binding protein [Spirochaetota bacterium]